MAKKINLFFVFFYILSTVSAATYTTTSTPGTYDIGGAPGASDDIIVNHDWSGYNAGALGNYTGTMTINNGGFYHINGSTTTWTGAVITIANTGNLVITGDVTLNTGLTMTNNGHFEVSSNLSNNVSFGGTGTYYVGGTTSGTGDFGSNTLGTLPVELISFSGEIVDNQTILSWSTGSEINNSHFEIQKSTDGKSFETIGIVEGYGNSSEIINYEFIDNTYSSNNSIYYRLKQINFNLKFEFSNTIIINDEESDIIIIQTETTNQFSINNLRNEQYIIEQYNMNGQLLHKETINGFNKVNYFFKLNFSGSYLLIVRSENSILTRKGIIQ